MFEKAFKMEKFSVQQTRGKGVLQGISHQEETQFGAKVIALACGNHDLDYGVAGEKHTARIRVDS